MPARHRHVQGTVECFDQRSRVVAAGREFSDQVQFAVDGITGPDGPKHGFQIECESLGGNGDVRRWTMSAYLRSCIQATADEMEMQRIDVEYTVFKAHRRRYSFDIESCPRKVFDRDVQCDIR